jgi:hypothetical protein
MSKQNRAYDFNIPPGGAFQLMVEGDYYLITSATNPINVGMDSGGGSMNVLAFQGEQKKFKRLTLSDGAAGVGSTGNIVVGDGSFLNQRIAGAVQLQAGSVVDIFNQSANGPKANQLFAGKARIVGATTPIAQLWNPLASGINAEVVALWLEATTAVQLLIGFDATQRNLVGNAYSMLGGGALSLSTLRAIDAGSSAGIISSAASPAIWVPASQTIQVPFPEPWVIPAALGLSVWTNGAATIDATFIFRER